MGNSTKTSFKDVLYPFTVWKNILKEPVTIRHPEKREGSDRYRGFHTNDIDKCIGCGTCEEICQNAAIDMVPCEGVDTKPGDSGLRPRVDYGRCCWCALCVDVCTTNSLGMSNNFRWSVEGENRGEGNEANGTPDDYRFIIGAENKYWDKAEKGYKKPDGYDLTPPDRVQMDHLSVEERSDSFIEMMKGYSKEQAKKEADRCVECGICTATCPAHMGIPAYIRAIREDDLEEGLRILYETNPLPEVCGRICTHKCESVCSIGNKGDAVSIRWLKRYIADNVPAEKYKEILGTSDLAKNGKKVAVVGAGPSGLSAAHYLALMGYQVTVFEALPYAGGMMRYGIPEYRLPYDQIDKDINYIVSLGVEIKTNCKVGKEISLEELKRDYDAVFAGTGLHLGRSTRIENSDHKKVFQSIDLLRKITLREEIYVPEKIVVIGGGNVAMDITRSLARIQRQKYGQVDIVTTCLEPADGMLADDEEVDEAKEEGAIITPSYGPQSIEIIDEENVKGLHVAKCLHIFDEEGRFNPAFDMEDSQFYEADMIIESIGQASDISYIPQETQETLEFNPRRQIVADPDYQVKNEPWLFVGGDIAKGPDVITGISTGHLAAVGIDRYLRGDEK
ncbi:MAG: FAD-dependent oxidoreductase [Spirochaetales bacterium]|nr:FAD-dependent oxidoreductase [Spirochaetales bacterium]